MAVYDFIEYGASSGFVYKSTTAGYYFSTATFTATVGTGTSTMTISAVTSGAVTVGMTLTGGTLSGTRTISSFGTFNGVSGTVNLSGNDTWANPTTVTGQQFVQITDGDYPATTVPGVVYLDGYIFVMDADATIYNSALQDPSSWNALDFITAEVEPSSGKAIAKYQNYIVALCEHTVEFFFDAANATGSPLSRMAQNTAFVGCEKGESVAYSAGTVFWIGKNKNRGRGVYRLNGLQPELVSTPAIDRILDTLTLTTVRAFGFRINGSHFYMLNCITDNLTLVFDVQNGLWSQWTYSTAGASQTLTSVTQTNGLATATKTSHGYSSGNLIRIAGATPAGYNGDYLITVIDANTFTFPVASTLSTPATGTITSTIYTAGYMPFVSYTYGGNKDLLQHETDGYVYEITPSVFQDLQNTTGSPIWSIARTDRLDGGSLNQKTFGVIEVVGDQASTTVFLRTSNDDAQNWSSPKAVDMSLRAPQARRNGRARRLVAEIHHVGNARCRLEALEIGE